MVRFSTLTALALVLSAPVAFGQQYTSPNLQEDNITRARPRTPSLPNDYVLISPGGRHYLRFDLPLGRITIDQPELLEAEFEGTSVLLTSKGESGLTRVVIQGQQNGALNPRLLFHAVIGIGSRIVTGTGPTARSFDCTPLCVPTPGREPKEPDQIIEYRGNPPLAPPIQPLNR